MRDRDIKRGPASEGKDLSPGGRRARPGGGFRGALGVINAGFFQQTKVKGEGIQPRQKHL